MAINCEDLIRYDARGNGLIIPALIPVQGFGYDPDLAPYAYDPDKAHSLLREAGYPDGLSLLLLAPVELEIQATVIGKMLECVGFTVDRQILDPAAFNRRTLLSTMDQPPEQQTWDIALIAYNDWANIPVLNLYQLHILGGPFDWGAEKPELQRLYAEVLRTVDLDKQQALIRQMERRTRDHAYALFLYNPIQLSAVNKAVEFIPYRSGALTLAETSVMAPHWSLRQHALKE